MNLILVICCFVVTANGSWLGDLFSGKGPSYPDQTIWIVEANLSCSLGVTFCTSGSYVEIDSLIDREMVTLPTRCTNSSVLRHRAEIVFDNYDGIWNNFYEPGLHLVHNCSTSGATLKMELQFPIVSVHKKSANHTFALELDDAKNFSMNDPALTFLKRMNPVVRFVNRLEDMQGQDEKSIQKIEYVNDREENGVENEFHLLELLNNIAEIKK